MVNIMFSSARNCTTVTDYGASLAEHELFFMNHVHYIALSALPIFIKIPRARMCNLLSLSFIRYSSYRAFPFDVIFFNIFFFLYFVFMLTQFYCDFPN